VLLAGIGGGCATDRAESDFLRVGISAEEVPPLLMRENGRLAGLEVEFAVLLGLEMRRPVQFVPLRRDELIDALSADRIDIIMAGLTVTPERRARVAFAEPYMKNAVMGLTRREEAAAFATAGDVTSFPGTIGVRAGSRADTFVQARCRQARRVEVPDAEGAVDALDQGIVDLYLDDAPAIVWTASLHEASCGGIWIPLTEDDLAWAVSRTNPELAAHVTGILRTWKREGRVRTMVGQWFPFAQRLEAPIGTSP
jgi:polar amino acid transport system substrate-binding protein